MSILDSNVNYALFPICLNAGTKMLQVNLVYCCDFLSRKKKRVKLYHYKGHVKNMLAVNQ